MFTDAIGRFYINDETGEWVKRTLAQSQKEEEEFVRDELKRLQAGYAKNEKRLHQIYEDKLNGAIPETELLKEKTIPVLEPPDFVMI